MAIHRNRTDIENIHWNNKTITSVYHGFKLVWDAFLRIWKGKQVWKGKKTWKY